MEKNEALRKWLRAYFIERNEPNVAWGMAISGGQFLSQLRGLWPMSSVDQNLSIYDLSGQNRNLTQTNTPTFGVRGICPYVQYNGANQYHRRATEPGLDITGALTIGVWSYFDNAAGANYEHCIGKWATQKSYQIRRRAAGSLGVASFRVSSDCSAETSVDSTGTTLVAQTWYFLAGRFTPATELKLWVSDSANQGQLLEFTNVAGIPGAICNSTAAFTIGANGTPANYQDGRDSLAFLCAEALPDAAIFAYYQWTRKLLGV